MTEQCTNESCTAHGEQIKEVKKLKKLIEQLSCDNNFLREKNSKYVKALVKIEYIAGEIV